MVIYFTVSFQMFLIAYQLNYMRQRQNIKTWLIHYLGCFSFLQRTTFNCHMSCKSKLINNLLLESHVLWMGSLKAIEGYRKMKKYFSALIAIPDCSSFSGGRFDNIIFLMSIRKFTFQYSIRLKANYAIARKPDAMLNQRKKTNIHRN